MTLILKRNAQKKHKKKKKHEVDEKDPDPKKIGTLRLFSHIISQRLLPKGGRGEALHYLDIKQANNDG